MKLLVDHGANPFICPKFARGNFGNVVDFAVREYHGHRGKGRPVAKAKVHKKNLLDEFRSMARHYHLRYLFSKMLSDLIILFET